MRLLLPIAALAGLIAYQRPDWLQDAHANALRAVSQAQALGSLLGLAPDRASIAERAGDAAPDRAAVLPVLGRVAEAQAEAGTAPAGVPGSIKDPGARERLEQQLRSAAAAMAGSEAMGELRALQEARARLADLRERAAMARMAGGDAAPLDAQAREAATEAASRTDALVGKLAALGVPVSREAAENLAVSVNSDDVVALLAAYSNTEKLEAALRDAVTQAPDNEAVVRRYYAIHATLLASLETIQTEVATRIDNTYLPRLEAVDRETRELRGDAQAQLRGQGDAALKASLEANLRTQDLTLRATDLYRRYLQDQRNGLLQALQRTRAARSVADNTARTATLALDVAAMMRNNDRDFGAVMAVRPPVIVPFAGDALRREFEGLSRRLGQPTS